MGARPVPDSVRHLQNRGTSKARAPPPAASGKPQFNIETATMAAGFSFEVYNEPSERDARWERGADGCNVAFMSPAFARQNYAGRLEVRLREAKDLSTKQDNLAEALFSGAALDPYVIFALNQEGSDGPKEGAIGLERAVDRAKSSTRWSRNAPREDKKKNAATWDPEKETFYLYVRDPADAQLALTVFDAEMTREDEVLGAASLKLSDALAFDRKSGEGKWSGWMPLTWGKQDTADNAQLMGAVAGAAVGGPLGAAVGGFVGGWWRSPTGEVKVDLLYRPLGAPPPPATSLTPPPTPTSTAGAREPGAPRRERGRRLEPAGAARRQGGRGGRGRV